MTESERNLAALNAACDRIESPDDDPVRAVEDEEDKHFWAQFAAAALQSGHAYDVHGCRHLFAGRAA